MLFATLSSLKECLNNFINIINYFKIIAYFKVNVKKYSSLKLGNAENSLYFYTCRLPLKLER